MAWFVWQDAGGQRQAESWGGPVSHPIPAPESGTPAVCRCGRPVKVLTVWGNVSLPIEPRCVACGLPATCCTCPEETA